MDWLDSILEKIGIRFQEMSLKKTLWCYMTVAIVATLLAYALTFTILNGWENVIFEQNAYEVTYRQIQPETKMIVERKGWEVPNETNFILKVIHAIFLVCIISYPIIAICMVSHIYYQKKLKEPLERMVEEARYIERDDLSFPCQWESKDEMGKACEAIERMRKRLIENKKDLWDLMEEQRNLNAAFAHDLRTPLTVMQGYTELMIQFYPKGKISEEKLMDTVEALNRQVKRLKYFTETMKDMHSIEAIKIKKENKSLKELVQKVEQIAKGLANTQETAIEVKPVKEDKEGYFDENIILEVLENLLSNALRYAKNQIEVYLEAEEDILFLSVKDNGRGFTKEELYQATRPYYTDSQKKDEDCHYGLGLTICKMLCKKHGGDLTLSNSMDGGAIVCASFFISTSPPIFSVK